MCMLYICVRVRVCVCVRAWVRGCVGACVCVRVSVWRESGNGIEDDLDKKMRKVIYTIQIEKSNTLVQVGGLCMAHEDHATTG